MCFVLCCFVDATLKSTLCQSGTPVIKEAAPYCTHCETVPVLFFSASMKDPSFCFFYVFVTLKCLRHVHAAITRLFLFFFFSGGEVDPPVAVTEGCTKKKKKKVRLVRFSSERQSVFSLCLLSCFFFLITATWFCELTHGGRTL